MAKELNAETIEQAAKHFDNLQSKRHLLSKRKKMVKEYYL